jgi:precorrin-6B methylase 2
MQGEPDNLASSPCSLQFPGAGPFDSLRALLESASYTEAGICGRMGIGTIIEFVPLNKGRKDEHGLATPLDLLIRLFLDEEPVDAAEIDRLLPAARGLMETLGLLAPLPDSPGLRSATVAVRPLGPLYLAADRFTAPRDAPRWPFQDAVYPATDQTIHFLDSLPATPCRRLLDLGTGTGAAALAAAAGYAEHAWAFDITPRSTLFAEFNRRLNGLDNVTVGCGDLYEPAAGMLFDRIVAHPPYVPVPDRSFVFRDGGEDGEQVTRRIIEGLPSHLAPGGQFHGYGMASDREGEPFENRIRRWLGAHSPAFDVLLIASAILTPDAVKSPAGPEENAHWDRVFEKFKVRYLFYGAIVIERHAAARSHFTLRTQTGPRTGWREIEWLRNWLIAASNPGIEDLLMASRPSLAPDLELDTVQRAREGGLVLEECTLRVPYPFEAECRCHPWIARMVSGCDGQATGLEHLETCRRSHLLRPGAGSADFAHTLAGMITGGFLRIPEFPLPDAGK